MDLTHEIEHLTNEHDHLSRKINWLTTANENLEDQLAEAWKATDYYEEKAKRLEQASQDSNHCQ